MSHNYHQDYKVSYHDLEAKLLQITNNYLDFDESNLLIKLIIRTEKMNVSTHGLHYFVHSIYPHLKKRSDNFQVKVKKNIIQSCGSGGVGFSNLYNCLKLASEESQKHGMSLLLIKNPGKVGALRAYAVDLIKNGKLLFLTKNTASTQSYKAGEQLLGTNPICFGFPDSQFIYDSSTSATCTNGMRLMKKQNNEFDFNVGWDESGLQTNIPNILLSKGSTLSTFSMNDFWYKSFFLALVVESLAALAGGKTGDRVGEKKGDRLFSQEGLFGLVIDKNSFEYYDSFKNEIELLFKKIKSTGAHIPGSFDENKEDLMVSAYDWNFINSI